MIPQRVWKIRIAPLSDGQIVGSAVLYLKAKQPPLIISTFELSYSFFKVQFFSDDIFTLGILSEPVLNSKF